jgi:hypothetical protein
VQIVTPLTLLAFGGCSACIALGIAIGKRRVVVADPGDLETIVVQIRLARVFVFRVWLGQRMIRFGLWVIGGRAEVLTID